MEGPDLSPTAVVPPPPDGKLIFINGRKKYFGFISNVSDDFYIGDLDIFIIRDELEMISWDHWNWLKLSQTRTRAHTAVYLMQGFLHEEDKHVAPG